MRTATDLCGVFRFDGAIIADEGFIDLDNAAASTEIRRVVVAYNIAFFIDP